MKKDLPIRMIYKLMVHIEEEMEKLKTIWITRATILKEASMYEGLSLARITAQYKGGYRIITSDGERMSHISGKLRHETTELIKISGCR